MSNPWDDRAEIERLRADNIEMLEERQKWRDEIKRLRVELDASRDERQKMADTAVRHATEAATEIERLRATDSDMYYLRSILSQLRELQSSAEYGPTLGGEVLADNINWLDCYIERCVRERKDKIG